MEKLFKKALTQFEELEKYVRSYRGTIEELANEIGTIGFAWGGKFTAERDNVLCEVVLDENKQKRVCKGKWDIISVVDGDNIIGEYSYEGLKKRALGFDELTAQQLWELRSEITLGSCYYDDYDNSFGFNSKDVSNFFEGYLDDLAELSESKGEDPVEMKDLDNIDNLYGWYCSCEDYSWVRKEA